MSLFKLGYCSFVAHTNVCNNYLSNNIVFLSQQPNCYVPSIGSLGFHVSNTPLMSKDSIVPTVVDFGLPPQKYDNFDDDNDDAVVVVDDDNDVDVDDDDDNDVVEDDDVDVYDEYNDDGDEGREEFDSFFVSNKKLGPLGEVGEDRVLRREDVDLSFAAEKELRHQGTEEGLLVNEDGPLFLEEMDENVLSNRILELSRTNKIRSAMEYFRSMEMFGLCPNIHACNSLLSGLMRNGFFEDCFKVFNFTKSKRMTTRHTYSLILMACAKAQGCDSAVEFFRKLERDCDAGKDFDAVVYNTMISICKEVDNWSEIERLWRSMKENGCAQTLVTYRLLISSFVRCNQSELALYAYHEMVQNGFEPNSNILNSIICVCAKEGKWYDALNIFRKMLTADFKPNLVACNVLINSLGREGELKLAFQVYNTMKSLGQKPDAYTYKALMSSLNKADKHHEALQLYKWIERNQMLEFNKQLYNTVLMSCSKLRLWGKAVEILWQMEASGMSDLTVSYYLVIRTCELARKPKIAWQVYEHMVHQKCSPNIFTYLSIIRCCTKGYLYEELEELLNKVEPNAALYNAAIQGMCLRGKFDLANEVYTKMLELSLEPDVKTQVLMHPKIRK
ncbi:pentatricopeptide repeat-containing protein At3g29290 isoform X2 [Trifolium pratense]|uniref:pentatricopeptide repeat-containing protein At3g29290 isoform X2 n=1 Tax=Trifolium pratense TaxID=57577 RepID=UPI001E693719|nr:pentatricopeptide repeat-containing protein At3g29290 isoform X2 [Trifolium pratense]